MSCKYLAVVAGILVLGAMPAFAHTVTLTADCTEFTIEASNFGTGTVVSYTITLIPSSGSNITVSGSITSDSGPQTTKWADVGVTLNGD